MKRVKRRYLSLKIDSKSPISERDLADGVWSALIRLYGEYGASLASLALISYDPEAKKAVLRTNLQVADNVRSAIASITSISGNALAVHVTAISGTIKSLRENS